VHNIMAARLEAKLNAIGEAKQTERQRTRFNWQVLAATWLGEMFDGMDASIYVLVMYQCLSELIGSSAHSTVAPIGATVLAIFIVGWVVGGITCGVLADYYGRSKVMLATILVYAAASGLCALSHNWVELACYRFLVGFGIGGEIGLGAVLVAETFKGRSRLHAASFIASSFAAGYLLAAVANLYLGHLGWRYLFLLGVTPALVTLYFRTKLKEPEHFEQVQRAKLIEREIAKACGSKAIHEPFTLPQIFSRQNLAKTLAAIGLSTPAIVGYWAVLSWLPAWVTQMVGGEAIVERSVTAVALNIGGLIGALGAGLLVEKIGRAKSFRLANCGALLCGLILFGTTKEYGLPLLSVAFLLGFFAQMLFALLFIYVPELYEAKIRCTGVTTSITVGRIFAAMAAMLGGQIIACLNGSYASAAILFSSVYCVGFIVSFFLPKHKEEVAAYAN
jgi:MFS family permease